MSLRSINFELSFWYLQFSQKNWLYYYGTSSWIVFIRFLGEVKTTKRHFEIIGLYKEFNFLNWFGFIWFEIIDLYKEINFLKWFGFIWIQQVTCNLTSSLLKRNGNVVIDLSKFGTRMYDSTLLHYSCHFPSDKKNVWCEW